MNSAVNWRPVAFLVAQGISSERWPYSVCWSLISSLFSSLDVQAFFLFYAKEFGSKTHLSWVLTQQSKMILLFTVLSMIYFLLLDILPPCKSLQVNRKGLHLPQHITSQATEYVAFCYRRPLLKFTFFVLVPIINICYVTQPCIVISDSAWHTSFEVSSMNVKKDCPSMVHIILASCIEGMQSFEFCIISETFFLYLFHWFLIMTINDGT